MTRPRFELLIALPVLLTCMAVGELQGQQPTDVKWALQAPLAASSLLLDADSRGPLVIAVGERGHVLVSLDDGETWQQGAVPTKRTLCAVDLLDEEHAWAAGHDAIIVHSTDGGQNWTRQHYAPEDESPLFDIWFENPRRGIAVGAYGLYLETDDGGVTWQRAYPTEEDVHFYAIAEAPSGDLYIAGELGTVLRSADKGRSWQACTAAYAGSYFGILPLQDDSVLVFGLRGNLFRTTDQGQSWQKIETDTSAALMGGTQTREGRVLIVGLSGCVLVSNDEVRDFRLVNRPDRTAMAAALALDSGRVLILGEDGQMTTDWSSLSRPATPIAGK